MKNRACCPACNHEWSVDGDVNIGACAECGDRIHKPAKPWNGEGLPPVGAECELYNCGQCHVGVIVYISDVYTIMKIDGQGEQHFHSSSRLQFKSLNPLQKLIDEADRICGEYSDTATCEKLIEAGYRKHTSLNRDFSTGDTKYMDINHWTAGVNVSGHINAIECYSGTKEGAELLRDEVLERLS